jgi:hypothetical protein
MLRRTRAPPTLGTRQEMSMRMSKRLSGVATAAIVAAMTIAGATGTASALTGGSPAEEAVSVVVRKKKEPVPAPKPTKCWRCRNDENGRRHCWEIPCPVFPPGDRPE